MRDFDPNPSLSAFVVVIGAALGLALALVLGLGNVGVVVLVIVGVLVAGFLASTVGLVGERGGSARGPTDDDLPPEYHEY